MSFAPYNEEATRQKVAERFRERTGHYPERILADQIYRTMRTGHTVKGMEYTWLERSDTATSTANRKQEYQDNTDRIEVERSLGLSKRCYGIYNY